MSAIGKYKKNKQRSEALKGADLKTLLTLFMVLIPTYTIEDKY